MQTPTPDPSSLDNLHDIVVLDSVPWWPLAPGWHVMGWVLLIALALATWSLIRKWRDNRYRRVALAELEQIEVASRDPAHRDAALGQLPTLVKRVALAAWPRAEVASLSGATFLEFLDATGRTQAFKMGDGKCLAALTYDPGTAAALDDKQTAALFSAVCDWVKRHRTWSPSPSLPEPGLKSHSAELNT